VLPGQESKDLPEKEQEQKGKALLLLFFPYVGTTDPNIAPSQ
jgi:hypothetical protein